VKNLTTEGAAQRGRNQNQVSPRSHGEKQEQNKTRNKLPPISLINADYFLIAFDLLIFCS
jgi:hypothetical protein